MIQEHPPASTPKPITGAIIEARREIREGLAVLINKTAAKELGVSVHTIAFHLRTTYEKLQIHSRSVAEAYALETASSKRSASVNRYSSRCLPTKSGSLSRRFLIAKSA